MTSGRGAPGLAHTKKFSPGTPNVEAMRVDLNFYGHVPMTDAGDAGPASTDRRFGNADFIAGYENLAVWCKTADDVGINYNFFEKFGGINPA